MTIITLQIPYNEYGPLATLAAAANMPLDKYIAAQTLSANANTESKKELV